MENTENYQRLIHLLRDLSDVADTASRRVFLLRIFAGVPGGDDIRTRVVLDGSPHDFSDRLLRDVITAQALPNLLTCISPAVGEEAADFLAGLSSIPLTFPPGTSRRLRVNFQARPEEAVIVFGEEATVGRSPECDFPLSFGTDRVSMLHARFSYDAKAGAYAVQDMESTNGTWVNGVRQDDEARLAAEDRIGLSRRSIWEFAITQSGTAGALVYPHPETGRPVNWLILAPHHRVYCGNGARSLLRLPFVRGETRDCGAFVHTSSGIYYLPLGDSNALGDEPTPGNAGERRIDDTGSETLIRIGPVPVTVTVF